MNNLLKYFKNLLPSQAILISLGIYLFLLILYHFFFCNSPIFYSESFLLIRPCSSVQLHIVSQIFGDTIIAGVFCYLAGAGAIKIINVIEHLDKMQKERNKMAITTNFKQIEEQFHTTYIGSWKSINEFEEYFLRRIQETMGDRNYYTDRNGIQREIDHINHFPELKEYEVWMEGFAATGESSGATLLGKAMARNFAQACDIVQCQNHLKWIEKVNQPDYKEYCPPERWTYDPNKLTDWGCNLYWSEELARKSFG